MSESNGKDTGSEDGKKKSTSADKHRARDLMSRDTPEGASTPGAGPGSATTGDRDDVYRPDANVDDQKSLQGKGASGHNSSIRQTPVSGSQVKEKTSQKANINRQADDAKSSRRNG